MNELLVASGLVQVTVAVLLGWPVLAFAAGAESVGPFKSGKRLLQCHLDSVFMGLLQLAIAGVHPGVPALAGGLLVFGSWANPLGFMLQSMNPKATLRSRAVRRRIGVSFVALTIAYLWLTVAWFARA